MQNANNHRMKPWIVVWPPKHLCVGHWIHLVLCWDERSLRWVASWCHRYQILTWCVCFRREAFDKYRSICNDSYVCFVKLSIFYNFCYSCAQHHRSPLLVRSNSIHILPTSLPNKLLFPSFVCDLAEHRKQSYHQHTCRFFLQTKQTDSF